MTDNFDVFTERKGQSAIEYLMTYGWMLLVVAIVGGAIFATVQGQCTQSSSGFGTTDVRISNFGVTAGESLAVEMRNAAADPVTITGVEVTGPDGQGTISYGDAENTTIDVAGTQSINFGTGVTNSQGCNTFDVTVNYTGSLGAKQTITGTLTNSMEIAG